jgi:hypothetical protein
MEKILDLILSKYRINQEKGAGVGHSVRYSAKSTFAGFWKSISNSSGSLPTPVITHEVNNVRRFSIKVSRDLTTGKSVGHLCNASSPLTV